MQVAPGTPIGLGDINLRVLGELYFYKDPGEPLYVDRVASTRSPAPTRSRDAASTSIRPARSTSTAISIPDLYVTVTRLISGVETRVTIAGPLREPELRLASTPPLDPSDILSLIVFGTSANELSRPPAAGARRARRDSGGRVPGGAARQRPRALARTRDPRNRARRRQREAAAR